MAFTIKAKALAEMVGIASKVCGGKSTIAIVECIRLRFAGDDIAVDTTDFDNWISIASEFADKMMDFETAIIPCKQFYSIISALPSDQDVSLSATDKRLTVKSGNSKYHFGLLPPSDWPTFPWNEKSNVIRMKSEELVDCLNFVDASMGEDATRYYMNGINLRSVGDKSLRFLATNGHCLSQAVFQLPEKVNLPASGATITPKLTTLYIELLSKLVDVPITLEITESKARLEFSGNYKISLMGRLIDGAFPDIDRVIPYKRSNRIVKIQRETAIANLRRIETFCDQRKRGVTISVSTDEKMRLLARNDQGEAEEIIAIPKQDWSGEFTVNIRLIYNLLLSLESDDVVLMMDEQKIGSAGIFIVEDDRKITQESDKFSLLMPMVG